LPCPHYAITKAERYDFFDFGGADEDEEAFSEGEATLEGERLVFELWHYHGDEYTFICERRR
jgi:hypothetical protein